MKNKPRLFPPQSCILLPHRTEPFRVKRTTFKPHKAAKKNNKTRDTFLKSDVEFPPCSPPPPCDRRDGDFLRGFRRNPPPLSSRVKVVRSVRPPCWMSASPLRSCSSYRTKVELLSAPRPAASPRFLHRAPNGGAELLEAPPPPSSRDPAEMLRLQATATGARMDCL